MSVESSAEDRTVYYQTANESRFATIVRNTVPPGAGPSPHYHTKMEESFYVLEGEFSIVCDRSEVRGGPGTFALVPAGKPHWFKNVGSTVGRILIVCCPPGHERYFRELDELARKGAEPTPEQMKKLRDRYDTVQLE
jgi:mannose-6-phosphate isomerase-like protein (cupin superfamily)